MPRVAYEAMAAALIGAAAVATRRLVEGAQFDVWGDDARSTFALSAGGWLASRYVTRLVPLPKG